MTLTQIIATCPNWRQKLRPLKRTRRGPTQVVDYRAEWAKRKARGISPHRRKLLNRANRTWYYKHREEILRRLRKKRART